MLNLANLEINDQLLSLNLSLTLSLSLSLCMIQGKEVDYKESMKILSENPNSKELSHHKEKP